MGLHGIGAVARVPRAVAAGERLVEARVSAGVHVERAEASLAHHCLRPCRQPLREGRKEREEEHVDEAGLRLPAADDGRRPRAVRDGSARGVDLEQPVEAVVDRQVGIDEALERVRAGGERLRVRRVHRCATLRVRPRRVEAHAVVPDLDACVQVHRLVGVAVGVDEALGLVDAVRKRRELGTRAALGVLEQLLHRRADRLEAVPLDESLYAADAGRIGGDLGAEVSRRLVLRPDLRQHEPEDVVDDPAVPHELDGRDDHAFLEDLAERADRRGRAAADVDVMCEVRDVAEQLALVVHGRDERDVV